MANNQDQADTWNENHRDVDARIFLIERSYDISLFADQVCKNRIIAEQIVHSYVIS